MNKYIPQNSGSDNIFMSSTQLIFVNYSAYGLRANDNDIERKAMNIFLFQFVTYMIHR